MDTEILVENGEVIGYALVGVIALVGLIIIQLIRRRSDGKKARLAVHLANLSISQPRVGPIAVTGSYRESKIERWLECSGQRVNLDGPVDVVRGSRARWHQGVRTYQVCDSDTVIAIGLMSQRPAGGWLLLTSPEEAGVLIYATKPVSAPPPLWPWRAPLFLIVCGAIGFGGLYGLGTTLIDTTSCSEDSQLRFEIATALPLVREQALIDLERCRKPSH